ncbi:hypothetical protein, partial [Gordonia cholesterolivorans]|uniref:hypothetical protein n=1 Tax=Gordonia cholesterolivorans TaxID=559625 RepID=UPI0031F83C8C
TTDIGTQHCVTEPRPSTLPDAPTNITLWAARSTDDHNKELALELPGPVIGDLPTPLTAMIDR